MHALPRSGRLVCWFNAWTVGEATPDDLAALVRGDDAAHDVVGLTDGPEPLLLVAGRLRVGSGGASLSLPVAGDPMGLAGPPELNMAALEAGEAALFPRAGVALVPEVVGAGVIWQALPCARAVPVVSVREAERVLREALLGCAERLVALDVATWRPEISEALSSLRDEQDAPLPPAYSRHASRLAVLALRCQAIVDLARENGSAAVTGREALERTQALRALDGAARHALAAACSEVPRRGHARVR
ncbi:MAG: hypothetical protein M3419_07450 [Actinomycetota bacterium]|nr:hypothetical protein [Actinomycetota bacterium]